MIAIVLAVLLIGVGLIIRDTVRRSGRWGINFRRNHCPRCERPLPRIRKPANSRQAMWGGGTCAACGCETDKWGRELA